MRCLRVHETKTHGHIYIPISFDTNPLWTTDDDEQLQFLVSCLAEFDDRIKKKQYLKHITDIFQKRINESSSGSLNEETKQEMGVFLFDRFFDTITEVSMYVKGFGRFPYNTFFDSRSHPQPRRPCTDPGVSAHAVRFRAPGASKNEVAVPLGR